jgi:hypothetical protein
MACAGTPTDRRTGWDQYDPGPFPFGDWDG